MATPRAAKLIDAIIDACERSGGSATLISGATKQPREFAVSAPSGDFSLRVYAWTLTHGGGARRPADEFRIQMTSVDSPLRENPLGETALVGYEPNLGVLVGFDFHHHRVFSGRSPSIQVNINAVREALQHGLAFHRKENGEIAVAVRPDQFIEYVRNARDLHATGKDARTFRMVQKATALEAIAPEQIDALTEPRKRTIQTVSRMSRDANFRLQVMNAYGHRCAVTGLQLKIVEAAHVLPVAAPGSIDDVRNGIALSPTYHKAYDHGLIYLGPDYRMRLNSAKAEQLTAEGLEGGLGALEGSLSKILLPQDHRQWPDPKLIRKANAFRGIPA